MDRIWKVTLILCGYGFFKEFRPSEDFLTEYLEGHQWTNLTSYEVNHVVYPVWIYSYLALIIPVFLLTDLLRYKPLILLEGISYVSTWILLIVGKGVLVMQLMEAVYGIATATEVAYYTYIYAAVERGRYQRVTSYVRGAILLSRFFRGVAAQLTVSFHFLDYYQLNFVSLGSVYVCLFLSNALPPVSHSIYFHKESRSANQTAINCFEAIEGSSNSDTADSSTSPQGTMPESRLKIVGRMMIDHLKQVWKSSTLMKWCLWWSVATSANILVGNNIQPLWETIYPTKSENKAIYNGAVASGYTLLGTLATLLVGHVTVIKWSKYSEVLLLVMSLIDAVLLYFMATTQWIALCYVLYICFMTFYQVLITVASFEVAKRLKDDSFGLIFGINTFFALLLSTIITFVLIGDEGFAASPRVQFQVYAGYFVLMAAAYASICIRSIFQRKKKNDHVDSENSVNHQTYQRRLPDEI